MPLLSTNHLDFSRARLEGQATAPVKTFTVHNNDRNAVLHMGIRAGVPWIEVYPSEFALGPGVTQSVVAELHPERAGDRALAASKMAVYGQYIAVSAARAGSLPPDVAEEITLTPPISDCPTCHSVLPEGVQECRRCGERIRLCTVCATPNTWLSRQCRADVSHVLRTEVDWSATPGGDSRHSGQGQDTGGKSLSRKWSSPGFPPTRSTDALEWSAPLAAFGLVAAAAIDSVRERATIYAMAIENGSPLWELDLPDIRGIYPDRGGMALSLSDGLLYAATLGGSVMAVDAIRGTLKWTAAVSGTVYGGVTITGDMLLIPADDTIQALNRQTGAKLLTMSRPGSRYDTAPATDGHLVVGAGDDGQVTAFDLSTGAEAWSALAGDSFDAAPIVTRDLTIVTSLAGDVTALALKDGSVRWRTKVSTRGIAVTPAISADGLLYAGADDGSIHIIASDTGHLIRSRRISDTPIRCAPVVCGHMVFAGAEDGSIYTVDPDYNVTRVYETTPGARISCAGLAVYGDHLVFPATNGVLYVLKITG